jgi:predicted permease
MMAQQSGGFGKVVLWVVLGIVVIIVAGNIIGLLLGALWNILLATLIIAAIAGVGLLLVGAARRSVSGRGNRKQLPR